MSAMESTRKVMLAESRHEMKLLNPERWRHVSEVAADLEAVGVAAEEVVSFTAPTSIVADAVRCQLLSYTVNINEKR